MSGSPAPRFSICDLHVGIEKTGSTSLQRFLGLNRANLLNQGIFVPEALSPGAPTGDLNHVFLTTLSFECPDGSNDLQHAHGLACIEDVRRHRSALVDALSAEITGVPASVKRLLLSNEHIHSRLRDSQSLHILKNFILQFSENIRVIVYLRAQHETALSAATTVLRNGASEFRPIPDFSTENGFDPILGTDYCYFDYDRLLTRLSEVFSDSAIEVRLYGEELKNRDVIDDFFSVIGIDIDGMERPRRENVGLDETGAAFLLALNKFISAHPCYCATRQAAIDYLACTSHGYGLRPCRASVAAFSALFDLPNERVRAKWFPHRSSLFNLDLSQFPETTEQHELIEDDYFALFCDLINFVARCAPDAPLLTKLRHR